jgi:hypothetical protein
MECYQSGCAERPTWKLSLTYQPTEPGAPPVALDSTAFACWNHRALLVRSYTGSRGALRIQTALRHRGVDAAVAERTVASVTPIFG